MKKRTQYFILTAILLLGAFLRLYKLSVVPPSASLDEASIGYNAYSILQTGKDEFGTPFPILLRAYDDWRPAPYVYLVIPFVKFIGPNITSVRLPSVILSIMMLFVTYVFVKALFQKERNAVHIAIGATLLLSISPWHIYISRLGHEVNLGLFADLVAMYFFVMAIERRSVVSLVTSTVFLVLALYSYQSQKVIVPLILIGLVLLYARQLWSMRKSVGVAAAIFIVMLIPLIRVSITEGALIRFQATSAFTVDNPVIRENQENFVAAKLSNNILGQIVSHKWFASSKILWANYIRHFDPRWLFMGTQRESHKIPYVGLLFWWELPIVITGMYFLMHIKDTKIKRLILLWLFVSPFPAAITTQAPHAMRSISMLPYWQIIGAFGTITMWETLKSLRKYISVFGMILIGFSLWQIKLYYFKTFPDTQSDSFQYALSEAIPYVLGNTQFYNHIVFSNQNDLYQSYMFFLFYSRYEPAKYLSDGGTRSGGFAETHVFDKYEFRPIDWSKDSHLQDTLFIGNTTDFPPGVSIREQFQYVDGKVGVVAVSPNL